MISPPANNPLVSLLLLVAVPLLAGGCDRGGTDETRSPDSNCIDTKNLKKGAERGSIVALTNPPVLDAKEVENLDDSDRVVALLVGKQPLAVPHKLLNQHEIVNLDHWLDNPITVTYCPLTKSSLAFDRSPVDGAEFNVSGLLLEDNLVMVDEREDESLWPQMQRSAVCGSASGASLDMVPVIDLQWGHWRSLHPDTNVLPVKVKETSSGTDNREYAARPERSDFETAPSGRVLGLPETSLGEGAPKTSSGHGRGGVAIPFQAFNVEDSAKALELSADSGPVVFWRPEAQAAMAFASSGSFSVDEEGDFVDEETGSVWTLDGRAIAGPRTGERLSPVPTAYVALWSAWSDFHPDTDVWSNDS